MIVKTDYLWQEISYRCALSVAVLGRGKSLIYRCWVFLSSLILGFSFLIANPSAHEKEHRHARDRTQQAQAPAHSRPSGMLLHEAGEQGADDAADRKGAFEEPVGLCNGALVAEDPRAFFFLRVDGLDDLGEAGSDDEGDGETDEGEKRAEKHFLFQACVRNKSEKYQARYGGKQPSGGEIPRAIFIGEVA